MSAQRLRVRHFTAYRYARPVSFGEHRLMFRPRDSHDIRLLDTKLTVSPSASIRYYHDPFNNSIAIATFGERATELRFESTIRIEHYGLSVQSLDIDPSAANYPFIYCNEDLPDLVRSIERHYRDPDRKVDAWARRFLDASGRRPTHDLLLDLNRAIPHEFTYLRRESPGVQSPRETLAHGSGSCRDFAVFFMEAARSLGFACRFITGYLFDPSLVGAQGAALSGSGATHAWASVYLPGAGWVEFDPTNNLVGGANLIRVGVTRDADQAVPVAGTYFGAANDFLGMEVDVTVAQES
jgi:transglutaminase-like putative cysteine protease